LIAIDRPFIYHTCYGASRSSIAHPFIMSSILLSFA
jgi:hypothetical protein